MKKFIYLLSFLLDLVLTPIFGVVVYVVVLAYMLYLTIREKGDVIATYKEVTTELNNLVVVKLLEGLKVHKERLLEV